MMPILILLWALVHTCAIHGAMNLFQEDPPTAVHAHTNRLVNETSPYLLQHAHNPVDWYPWGQEALERAVAENKPIFLSIGYSACHWCHVMERESFENESIAAYMNEHFVCIKVDREERPDLDDVYMKATQAMTGSGGWPMSVWLTPDRKPFYAGTYFPPDSRYGRPGFLDVLRNLAAAWEGSRESVQSQADKVAEVVQRMSLQGEFVGTPAPNARPPERSLIALAADRFGNGYDSVWGGFGPAPKFPHADALRLLLRHGSQTGDTQAIAMAEHTLDTMARGGIYDQLGGGFHRYSTDEKWWIPHFEKMLYDNALLVPAYLDAWRITGRADFARVARECCEWVLREMVDEAGGLYSTQDADSEGEEGKFYAWSREDVHALVGDENGALVDIAWNLGAEPNFEGRDWVLVRPRPDQALAADLDLSVEDMHAALEPLRKRLFTVRARRVHPHTDDKVLVAWNGLMIGALARASVTLDEPRFGRAARRAADFCLTTMRPDGERLLATYRAGKAHLNGTLPDYAYLADGLLDLFEADGEVRWALAALDLARVVQEHFADEELGGWFFTSDDHEALIARSRDLHDGALPSSSAVMTEVVLRLYELTGDDALRREAERALVLADKHIRQSPTAFPRTLLALGLRSAGATVVLTEGEGFEAMRAALARHPDASMMVVTVPGCGVPEDVGKRLALLAGKTARDGRATAYVCRNFVCKQPVTSVEGLAAQLELD